MASFQESESVQMVRQTVRDFAEKNIRPFLMDWDESQTFPIHIFKALGELGLMGYWFLRSTTVLDSPTLNMPPASKNWPRYVVLLV